MSARRGLRPLGLILACWPAVAAPQVPAGPELRVNTYTTGDQDSPDLAMDAAGNFVVAWTDRRDGDSFGTVAQRFGAAGTLRGAEFQANTYTTTSQYGPQVGVDAGGSFVVVWASYPQDGDGVGLFAQRYDAAGLPRGGEFRINAATTGNQGFHVVKAGPQGSFVVVWTNRTVQYDSEIFARRFDGSGAPVGGDFQVNTYTTGYQFTPALAVQPGGDFIVAWSGQGPDGINGGDVFARRYDAGGNPLGPQFRVNSYTTYSQALPAIAAGPSGDFVVVWEGGFNYEVYGQRFDAAGNPRGNEFLVNTYTTSRQSRPDVAADSAGGFVVTWTSYQGGGYTNVFGQRYDGNGSRRGAEFRVNTYTTGTQYQYGVASDPAGNFTVVWRSVSDQDGDGHSIHAQRFGGLQPAALAVDEPGNDVWEPGELAEVKPAWHNIHGAAQSFGGVLSNITGPAGATYGVADNSASYGSVPDGATASCTDCYVVLVNNPSSRPAAHWDATALETITPDAQGQVRRHTLHIGASFADISSGPFYRFVETLLHNGITSGCGDGNYCPGSATTRAQMSVFVLLAREGAGYAPPACTTPVFTDVPASNPFCRFIEELARRNVVSGCGPSLYCPDNPVTREQMSVFVLRTLDPVLDPPACVAGSELFADVPASSPFCRWIEELARRQVVSGCGDDNYCPTAPVTREQMGVFITVTFGLTLY